MLQRWSLTRCLWQRKKCGSSGQGIFWLKSGDRNTSFFHEKASKRHQWNTITRLLDTNGNWQDEEDVMGQIFVDYFQELFTSSYPTVSDELLETIHPKVTNRMNEVLL